MKTPRYSCETMDRELQQALSVMRAKRGFDARQCLEGKILSVNRYLQTSRISAAVIGVSGGVDSAVTLGILKRASQKSDTSLKRIVAALLPYGYAQGVTNQESATSRGKEVAKAFEVECVESDLGQSLLGVKTAVSNGLGINGDPWADGQLAAYLRTPALYYMSALLAKEGFASVVCGTTNRDEGAYLGFFGKASDGMVDLQIISDLHKSEVYQLAGILNVPHTVIKAHPSGDVFDGKTHLQMIGAPYDFIELYLNFLTLSESEKSSWRKNLSASALAQFAEWGWRIESMHALNRHKYLGGSPSVHFDLYKRGVPGGWRESHIEMPTVQNSACERRLVGEFELDADIVNKISAGAAVSSGRKAIRDFGDSAFVLHRLLRDEECDLLYSAVQASKRVPVGQNGVLKDYKVGIDTIGSYRATAYSEALADVLWKRLEGKLPMVRVMRENTPTDFEGHQVWRAVGVNPALRFIWYESGGALVPHYDAGFCFQNTKRRTLMSMVIYLTPGESGAGGRTRFILDPQRHLPLNERDYSDWKRAAAEDAVLDGVLPQKGQALIFDHRILHDAEGWSGKTPRVVIRTDIIFEKCCADEIATAEQVPQQTQPLWLECGLTPDSSIQEIDRVCLGHYKKVSGEAARSIRYKWKLLRDPFYAGAYNLLGSEAEIVEAGFVDDGSIPGDEQPISTNWLATPLHKIVRRLTEVQEAEARGEELKPLAVLVSTGAFCPVHIGHIEMMEIACREIEARGFAVLGGYLCPDNDRYVGAKCGTQALSAAKRVELLQFTVQDSAWLMVDGYEALYAKCAVNFTDVIARLERYLSAHMRCARPIHVVFVAGGDNANFALAFAARGRCVIVARHRFEARFCAAAKHPLVIRNERVIFSKVLPECVASSTDVRNGKLEFVAQAALPAFVASSKKLSPVHIFLRNEGEWSVSQWVTEDRDAAAVVRAQREFVAELRNAFIATLAKGAKLESENSPHVELISLSDQLKLTAVIRQGKRVCSTDPCILGDENIGISRCFELADSTRRAGLVARPGWPTLAEQIARLQGGEYLLLEDDVATGKTLESLKQILPAHIVIRDLVALNGVSISKFRGNSASLIDKSVVDIGDVRDFLAGARDGGLVVSLPNGALVRTPYLFPYVRVSDRMSLPVEEESNFSKIVWKLNFEFFSKISPAIRVSEASEPFRKLALYVGFRVESKLEELCAWHLRNLGGGA